MTLPENARLLRTNELPPLGSRVYVPENTTAVVGDLPAPGWQPILATDSDDSTVAVKSANGHASWVLSHNLLVNDKDRRPTVGDRVTINALGEKYHGMTGTLAEDDGTDLPFWVRFENHGAEWFYPQQVSLVPDEASPASGPTTITTTTHVTIPRPATAEQVADALTHVDGHHAVTVHTYADHIEIHAHHKETRG